MQRSKVSFINAYLYFQKTICQMMIIKKMQQQESNLQEQKSENQDYILSSLQNNLREQPARNSNSQYQHQPTLNQIPVNNMINGQDQINELKSVFSINIIQEQIIQPRPIIKEQQQIIQSQYIGKKFLKKLTSTILQILETSGTIPREVLKDLLWQKLIDKRQSLNTKAFKIQVDKRFSESIGVLKGTNKVKQYKQKLTLMSNKKQNKNQSPQLTELKKELEEKKNIMEQKNKKLQYFYKNIPIYKDWLTQNSQNMENQHIQNDKINFPSFPCLYIVYDINQQEQIMEKFKQSSQIYNIQFKANDIPPMSNLSAIAHLMNFRQYKRQMEAKEMRQMQMNADQFM